MAIVADEAARYCSLGKPFQIIFSKRTEGNYSIAAVFKYCLFQSREFCQSRGGGFCRIGTLKECQAPSIFFAQKFLDESCKRSGVCTAGEIADSDSDGSAGQVSAIGVSDEKPDLVPYFQHAQ
jgi:hypothetical protein